MHEQAIYPFEGTLVSIHVFDKRSRAPITGYSGIVQT
jgi:hypothetical protein